MTRLILRIGSPLLLLCLLLAALLTSVRADEAKEDPSDEQHVPREYLLATGGPDRFGYSYSDSSSDACPYEWHDPAAGEALSLSDKDDGISTIGIGFDFPFYGATYNTVTVDSNGALLFGEGASEWVNRPIGVDDLAPRIAPFWDDLKIERIVVERRAVPAQALIVTFAAERGGQLLHFQLLLHEDGRIRFHYDRLEGALASGVSASVGIQGTGTGLGYLFNGFPRENRLRSGLAICFQPPSESLYLSTDFQRGFAAAGHSARYTVAVVNQTADDSTFQLSIESEWPAAVEPEQVLVPAGESVEVTLLVQVPDGAAGEASRTTLRARGGASAATTELRTTRTSGEYGFTAASTSDDVAAWDLVTNTVVSGTIPLLESSDPSYPYDATIHQSGAELWIADASYEGVIVLDSKMLTVTQRIPNLGDYPVDVLFSKDGTSAFVSSRNSADDIVILDTATYSVTGSIPVTGLYLGPGKMALNHCTGELYVANWYDDYFFVIDPETQSVVEEFSLGSSLWDLVVSPDASTIYVTDRGSDEVHVLRADTYELVTSIPVGDDPWGIDITPDGSLLFVANEDSHDLSVIDTALNVVTSTITLTAPDTTDQPDPRDIEITEDGAYAYVPSGDLGFANDDDYVLVIEVATLSQVDALNVAPARNPNVIAVAPQRASLDPTADFTSDSPVPLGTPVSFTDMSENEPTEWFWDFGDGVGTSTEQHPTYNYAAPGSYEVTLTVTNQCGSDSVTMTVEVEGEATPTPEPTATSTLPAPTATSTLPAPTATSTLPAPTATSTLPAPSPTGTVPAATPTGTVPAATPTGTIVIPTVTSTVTATPDEALLYLPIVLRE